MQREEVMGDLCRNEDDIFAHLDFNHDRVVVPHESFTAGVAFSGSGPDLPETCGTGHLSVDALAPGIVVGEIETLGATEEVSFCLELAEPMYAITVHLGYETRKVDFAELDEPLTLRRGYTYLLAPQTTAATTIRKGAGCHEFVVFLHPDTVINLLEGDGMPAREKAARFLKDSGRSPVLNSAVWTPGIRSAVNQMRTCPYCGTLRTIYLESKVLELFVLCLESIFRVDENPEAAWLTSGRDRRMLEEARCILEASIKDPPTIGELARMVGTNRTNLKKGFRSYFGSCVFEYLRRCRMEQALLLLRDYDMNVNEVAAAVGYSSVSAFSAAFHKCCGFPPREARRIRISDSAIDSYLPAGSSKVLPSSNRRVGVRRPGTNPVGNAPPESASSNPGTSAGAG